tara:strand:+ start:3093 stop:4328 length:1236 start_codon:yes stop_codon:yes gene_type:complete
MASFQNTTSPTPFGIFDDEKDFIIDANSMVTFVKRKLGDDILSVELTNKQIWMSFEESTLEYSRIINEYQTKSQLGNLLGNDLGTSADNQVYDASNNNEIDGGPRGAENKFPRETLEFLMRKAEPYASHAGTGGSYNIYSGSITLVNGQQDYNLYDDMTFVDPADGQSKLAKAAFPKQKLRIYEIQHFSPQAAYRFFDTTSAINYLNNEFAFESFTPETVFYVLPVFEDLLRAQQMDISNRVRRSNYSYELVGQNIRIFPRPTVQPGSTKKLWIRFSKATDGLAPDIEDGSIDGVSGYHNIPFNDIKYQKINSMGRQWIRQYTFALSKEVLGLVRSKFGSIPIPNGDLQLNGSDLLSQGQAEKEKLITQLREMLDSLTYDKLLEGEAAETGHMQTILKSVPIPLGKCITIG